MKKITSRRFHKMFSLVIGIQLLLWTVSGLIFSWNPIDKVRGENRVAERKLPDLSKQDLLPLNPILNDPKLVPVGDTVESVVVGHMLDWPVYQIGVRNSEGSYHVLCNAATGERLSPIPREVAEKVALEDFAEPAKVKKTVLLEEPQGSHSEYRKRELPAWKIELDHSSGTVIYVSADRGTVVTRRNNRWRLFDFFWMLHTMDFQGRDNFNSWLLRIMSVMGVISVLSGYWLWYRGKRRNGKPKSRGPATRSRPRPSAP